MRRILLHIDCLVDGTGFMESPAALLMEGDSVVQVGSPQSIGPIDELQITQIHGTVMPSFVNAHTHLDITVETSLPQPMEFVPWVKEVVAPVRRNQTADEIKAAVQRGAQLSKEGGCFTVGDIAGSLDAVRAFQESELFGISFLELIGTGTRNANGLQLLDELPVGCGVQPHAPYSCSKQLYEASFSSGRPIATHLAETLDEIECLEQRTGSIVEFAKTIGVWDGEIGHDRIHPVDAICDVATRPFLAAHCHYIEDRHVERLHDCGVSVVYCPRASAFFGHKQHPWERLLEHGVNVALGTDSILCLDTSDRLTVLDDMRYLIQKGASTKTVLRMGTINGAIALGLDPSHYQLTKGKIAGLIQFSDPVHRGFDSISNSHELPTPVTL